jgi:hypothetical protein
MTPHRLRRDALPLPARRSRQNANVIHGQALTLALVLHHLIRQPKQSFLNRIWISPATRFADRFFVKSM